MHKKYEIFIFSIGSQTGIEELRKQGISSGQVKLLSLDLKSLQSVRQFADNVLSSTEGKRIDILINNGIKIYSIQIKKWNVHYDVSIYDFDE